MMHPNWLLVAAVLSLWGPLSLDGHKPAQRFANRVERAIHRVGLRDLQLALVCGEGDPLAEECR